jgi:hypothetical protein
LDVHVTNTSDDPNNPAPDAQIYADYGNDDLEYLGAIPDGGGDLYLSHAWPDDGNFTVNVTAGDPSAPDAQTSFTVSVIDISPDIRLGGPNFANLNRNYSLELFHDDPGLDPLDHWNINWGDGSSTTAPGDAATATHVYTTLAASQTIQVSAVEADTGLVWPNPASPSQTIDTTISVIQTVPDAPTAMAINPQSRDKIQLAWAMPTDTDATGYHLQVSSDGVNFTPFATITNGAARHYLATGLSAITNYSFSLTAYNDLGDSDYAYTSTASTTNDDWEDVGTVTPTPSTDPVPSWFTPLPGQGDGDYFDDGVYQLVYAGGGYQHDTPPYDWYVWGNYRVEDRNGGDNDTFIWGAYGDTLEQVEHDTYATDPHPGFLAADQKIGLYIGPESGPGVAWTLQRKRPHAGVYSLADSTTEGDTDPYHSASLWFWRDDHLTEDVTLHFTLTPSQYLTTDDYTAVAKIPQPDGTFSEVPINLSAGQITLPPVIWAGQQNGIEVDITATNDTTPEWTEDFSVRLDDDATYVADHPNDTDGFDADGVLGDVDPDAKIELVDNDIGMTLHAQTYPDVGALLWVNHPGPDAEPFVPLDLNFPQDVKHGAKVILSVPTGGITIWDSAQPGGQKLLDTFTRLKEWVVGRDTIPRIVYVEATEASWSAMDTTIQLDDDDQTADEPPITSTHNSCQTQATRDDFYIERSIAGGQAEIAPAQPGKFLVGQSIHLTAHLTNNTPLPVTLQGWDLGFSNLFKDYQITRDSGVVTLLSADDKKQKDIVFYVNEFDGSATAKYSLTVGGQAKSAQTTLTVVRPNSSLQVTAMGSPGMNDTKDQFELVRTGPNKGGINFSGDVSLPAGWNDPGRWMFMQMGSVGRTRWLRANSQRQVFDLNNVWALDGRTNYSPWPQAELAEERGDNGNSNYWSTGTGAHPTGDTPETMVVDGTDGSKIAKVEVDDYYRMYLIFLPPGANSVWVSLNSIDWRWGGAAETFQPYPTQPKFWEGRVVPGTPFSERILDETDESYEVPTWDKNIDDADWVDVNG